MAERVSARIAAFMPGASPPEVRIPMHFMFDILVKMGLFMLSGLVSIPLQNIQHADAQDCRTIVKGNSPAGFVVRTSTAKLMLFVRIANITPKIIRIINCPRYYFK